MITIEHLTKCYNDFIAVDDLSVTIQEGHVYGFLGPNGAGKSTTMNIMTGCLSATEGSVKIDGYDIFEEPNKAKKLIGYLPEQPPLYMNETPIEYLTFVGEAKGLKGAKLKAQIESVVEKTRLEHVKYRRIGTLSKGYKQRVGIAQALLGNPKVIILDEPTVGLDPIQIIEIRDLIKELGKSHTVIFSSHILSEVQEVCDKVLIIAKGKLILFDDTDNVHNGALGGSEISITTEASEEVVQEIVQAIPEVEQMTSAVNQAGYVIAKLHINHSDIHRVSRKLFFAFAEVNSALLEMTLRKASLEDIFIQLTEECIEEEELDNTVESGGDEQ